MNTELLFQALHELLLMVAFIVLSAVLLSGIEWYINSKR